MASDVRTEPRIDVTPAVSDSPPDPQSAEVQKLLELAEKLQDRCNRGSRNTQLVIALAILIAAGALMSTAVAWHDLGTLLFPLLIAGFAVAAIFYLYIAALRPLQVSGKHDRRALNEVVRILRESVPPVIRKQNWSMLQIADFKIRLSRFDIGPLDTNHGSLFPETVDELFSRVEGLWHLDYSFGAEDARIDREGRYYYRRQDNIEELAFILQLQEYEPVEGRRDLEERLVPNRRKPAGSMQLRTSR